MRVKSAFVFGLGLGAALALTPGAQAQMAVAPGSPGGVVGTSLPAGAIPLNIAGTYTMPKPPAGFNPATASAATLQSYGLPPAPSQNADSKAYAAWLNAVSMPNRITPVLQKEATFHGPMRAASGRAPAPPMGAEQQAAESPVQSTLTDSYNWSGYSVYDASAPFNIEAVIGTYVVPVARNPFGQCPSNPQYDTYSSNWVGIDGLADSVVFQNGTEADSYNDCAGSYQYYYSWLEWYPGPSYAVLNAPVEGGDYIFLENWTESSTTGCFFWANTSQQWYGSICTSTSAIGGGPVQGTSIEWIVERPYTGEHQTGFGYLTNYVTVPWWETYAYNYTSSSPTAYYPGSAPSGTVYQIYAVDDSGGLISYPYLTGTDSIFFYDYGSAYCSPGASCTPRY